MATLTWLGHASFRLDTDGGKRIYIDPFLQGNPKTPDSEKDPERCDVIAITHAHGDHLADAVDISKKFPDAEIVAMIEVKDWLGAQGANVGDWPGINKGGTQEIDGVKFTLTDARHSAGLPDGSYGGEAAGLVIRVDGKSVYFAGDTCVFGDMALPAVPLRDVPRFDRLAGRAGEAHEREARGDRARREHRAVRERWFGATGRRVPEIALAGDLDLEGALVLDRLDDEAMRAAHAEGRPVVVRTHSADEVKAALARPEVASALVDDPALLELDLTELTYG